jgi:hypothetical protein
MCYGVWSVLIRRWVRLSRGRNGTTGSPDVRSEMRIPLLDLNTAVHLVPGMVAPDKRHSLEPILAMPL